jgi:hypothetical protein
VIEGAVFLHHEDDVLYVVVGVSVRLLAGMLRARRAMLERERLR